MQTGSVAPSDIDTYLAAVDEPMRSTLEWLRRSLREVIPKAEESISYGMPAFKVNGKTVAGFAAFKSYLSYLTGHTFTSLSGQGPSSRRYVAPRLRGLSLDEAEGSLGGIGWLAIGTEACVELVLNRCALDALEEHGFARKHDRGDLIGFVCELPQIEPRDHVVALRLLSHIRHSADQRRPRDISHPSGRARRATARSCHGRAAIAGPPMPQSAL